MTGGKDEIVLDVGEWLHMCQGKKILSQVINSDCFQVTATDGSHLSGKAKINEVVKDLLKQNSSNQPDDFVKLKGLVEERINETA